LNRETTITAQYDRLTDWAAREIKIAIPFGNDHVVLEIKARHRVGINDKHLGNLANFCLAKLRAVLGVCIDTTQRNGQVVRVKTEIDGIRIAVSLARIKSDLIELPLNHVPPPPGPKPKREVVPDRDAILLRAGFSHRALELMSEETKDRAACELAGFEVTVPAGDYPEDIDFGEQLSPPGASYTTNRKPTPAELLKIGHVA
jgi:hypothetical protein